MDQPVVSFIMGFLGVLTAAIPAYIAQRKAPSRVVADTAKIIDASGGVLTTMQGLIDRLNDELDEAQADAQGARTEARSAMDRAETCAARNGRLERQLKDLGVEPVG